MKPTKKFGTFCSFIFKKKGENANHAAKNNCNIYEPTAVSVREAQNWLSNFSQESDAFRSGPVSDKRDDISEKNILI